MIRTWLMAGCAVLLGGCRLWAAGDDPAGRALMANAQTVLDAANRYVRANGQRPPDLGALVPQYLATLPAEPALNYSPKRGSLIYNYQTTWPLNSVSACEAKLGETAFHCAVYN
jgi:hypothetical protein